MGAHRELPAHRPLAARLLIGVAAAAGRWRRLAVAAGVPCACQPAAMGASRLVTAGDARRLCGSGMRRRSCFRATVPPTRPGPGADRVERRAGLRRAGRVRSCRRSARRTCPAGGEPGTRAGRADDRVRRTAGGRGGTAGKNCDRRRGACRGGMRKASSPRVPRAAGRSRPRRARLGPAGPVALASAYLGDVAIASPLAGGRRGGGIELRVERHAGERLRQAGASERHGRRGPWKS